jgi:hypothetical protein
MCVFLLFFVIILLCLPVCLIVCLYTVCQCVLFNQLVSVFLYKYFSKAFFISVGTLVCMIVSTFSIFACLNIVLAPACLLAL